MLAVDCEMMDDKIHEFFVFIQRLLFPVNSGERPLRQNDMSILDFIFSDLFKNACIRNIRADDNFLGGSTVLTQMLEDLKEERRKNPKEKASGARSKHIKSSFALVFRAVYVFYVFYVFRVFASILKSNFLLLLWL